MHLIATCSDERMNRPKFNQVVASLSSIRASQEQQSVPMAIQAPAPDCPRHSAVSVVTETESTVQQDDAGQGPLSSAIEWEAEQRV